MIPVNPEVEQTSLYLRSACGKSEQRHSFFTGVTSGNVPPTASSSRSSTFVELKDHKLSKNVTHTGTTGCKLI